MSNDARDVEIQIDVLELAGFDPARRFAIAEAVHVELTRLLQDGSLPSTSREQAGQTVQTKGLRADASPRAIGLAVARAIYGALPHS